MAPLFPHSHQTRCASYLSFALLTSLFTEPTTMNAPFWFNTECPEHVKSVLASYAKRLNLNAKRSKFTREPPLFIARVHRIALPSASGEFCTLDHVDVCRHLILTQGSSMPVVETFDFVTLWDDDGMPQSIESAKKFMDTLPSASVLADLPCSFLLCQPVFCKDYEYRYRVSETEETLSHSDLISHLLVRQQSLAIKQRKQKDDEFPCLSEEDCAKEVLDLKFEDDEEEEDDDDDDQDDDSDGGSDDGWCYLSHQESSLNDEDDYYQNDLLASLNFNPLCSFGSFGGSFEEFGGSMLASSM